VHIGVDMMATKSKVEEDEIAQSNAGKTLESDVTATESSGTDEADKELHRSESSAPSTPGGQNVRNSRCNVM